MAFIAGKNSGVLFGAFDLTSYFNNFSFSRDMNAISTTMFGDDNESFIEGISTANLDISGLFDGTTDAVDEELTNAFATTSATPLTVFQNGTTAGEPCVVLNSKIQNYTIDSSVSEAVGVSSTFTGDNFGRGLSLYALTNTSATATTTAVDFGSSTTFGGQAFLHCTADSSANIAVKLQSSADNSSFADVTGGGFTAITGTTSERIAPTGTINRYVRLVITVTGGAATFQVSFSPNKK
jgi:hypothetical protein